MPQAIEEKASSTYSELEQAFYQSRYFATRRPQQSRSIDETPRTIAPEKLRLASAGIKYLSAIIRQLMELRNSEPETDDYGILRATQSAFDAACHLLTDAAIISALNGWQIPNGYASTDARGGLRIEWVRATASVHLAVPADREAYLYHEVGDVFATVPATPEALARWLREID